MTDRGTTKIVRCCHCRGMMRIPARALSVFCPHCQKRVTLESLRIIGSHPGRTLATCGDVYVEAGARLNLAISANSVVIHGRVRGPITANLCAEIGPTAHVVGDIKAPKIIVHDGAVIDGRCEMTRRPEPAAGEPDTADADNGTSATGGPTPPEPVPDDTSSSAASAPAVRPRPLPPPPGRIKPLRFTQGSN